MRAPKQAFTGKVFRFEYDLGVLVASAGREHIYLHSLNRIADFLKRDDISAGTALDVVQHAIINRLEFNGEKPLIDFRLKKKDSIDFYFTAKDIFECTRLNDIEVLIDRFHEEEGDQSFEVIQLQFVKLGNKSKKFLLKRSWRNRVIATSYAEPELLRFSEDYGEDPFRGHHFRFSIENDVAVARSGNEMVRFERMEDAFDFLSRDDVTSGAAVDLLEFMFLRHFDFDEDITTTMEYRVGRKDSLSFGFNLDDLDNPPPDSEGAYDMDVTRKVQGKHRFVTFEIRSQETGQRLFRRAWREMVFRSGQN